MRRVSGIFIALALGFVGFFLLLISTRWGIGASPDSAVYIGAARNLLGGHGLSVPFGSAIASPLTQYPPLYPGLLAAIGVTGVDPAEAARWLNAVVFAANIVLAALAVQKSAAQAVWAPVAISLIMLVSPFMLGIHVMAWSEALFISLSLSGLLLLAQYFTNANWKYLILSSAVIGLAFLTRYAGIVLVATGVAGLLLLQTGSIRDRIARSAIFGLLGALPVCIWSLRNLIVVGTATNRSVSFHPIGLAHLWQAVDTVAAWIAIPGAAPRIVKLGVLLGVLAGWVGLMYWQRGKKSLPGFRSAIAELKRVPDVIKLLIFFGVLYGCFLIGSISFVDANTPLDARILFPIYVAGVIILVGWALTKLQFKQWPRLWQLALGVVGFAIVAVYLFQDVGFITESYRNGIGFNHSNWRNSPTLAQVNALPYDTLIYSNAPEAVYLQTGRSALRLPRVVNLMEGQANANYSNELAEMKMSLLESGGVVIYFNTVRGGSIPTEEELIAVLHPTLQLIMPDGAIYEIASAP